MSKYYYYFSLLVFITIFGLLIFLNYLLFYPFKVIEIKTPLPVTNKDKIVHRGEVLEMVFDYQKFSNPESEGYKNLVCEHTENNKQTVILELPKASIVLPVGKVRYVSRANIIPNTAPTGRCRIVFYLYYKILPFRSINVIIETETFTIK